jgi:hypothetical protein
MSSHLPNKIAYDDDTDTDIEFSLSTNDGLTEPETSIISNPLADDLVETVEHLQDQVVATVEHTVEHLQDQVEHTVDAVIDTAVDTVVTNVVNTATQALNSPAITQKIQQAQQVHQQIDKGLQFLSTLKSTPKSSVFSKLSNNLTAKVLDNPGLGSGAKQIQQINELIQKLDVPPTPREEKQVAIDIPQPESDTSEMPPTNIKTTRNRKLDRRNLANDILAELPIAIRFNEGMFLDNDEQLDNYVADWNLWADQTNSNADQLKVLIEQIACDELKYKSMASANSLYAKIIQVSLMILGSAIVYIQAKGSSPEVVNDFNIASGAATTIASILLQYCNFTKKAPHFSKIQRNLQLLRSWIDNKLVLPISKRFSPFDIFIISRKAYDTIILEAKNGLENTK